MERKTPRELLNAARAVLVACALLGRVTQAPEGLTLELPESPFEVPKEDEDA